MGLEDIQKAISQQAETQIAEINKERDEKVANVVTEWNTKAQNKQQALLDTANRKANQRLQQARFAIKAQGQTEVLARKQRMIDRVYQQAATMLAELDDTAYVEFMAQLIEQLPQKAGSLSSVEGKGQLLKKALNKSKAKHEVLKETVKGSGGFWYRSSDVEINNTFASLVDQAKDNSQLEVTQLLFSQSE